MKKQAILTMATMTGLLWAGSAFANGCFCQVGHLAGNVCLAPVPNSTGGGSRMQPVANAICPSGAPPQPRQESISAADLAMLNAEHKVALAFNEHTGSYGIVVSTLTSHPSPDVPKKLSNEDYTRLVCVSKDTGIAINDLMSKKAQRQHKNNACAYVMSSTIANNRLVLWRAKLPSGKYKIYTYKYHTELWAKFAQTIQNEGLAIKAKCEKEGKCEFIGEFGKTLGVF